VNKQLGRIREHRKDVNVLNIHCALQQKVTSHLQVFNDNVTSGRLKSVVVTCRYLCQWTGSTSDLSRWTSGTRSECWAASASAASCGKTRRAWHSQWPAHSDFHRPSPPVVG